MLKILFVCMGNICRSPTAEGVFRAQLAARGLADRVSADSAGTHGYHTGAAPDPRTQQAARRRGYELSRLSARAVRDEDFVSFDLIAAMDRDNLAWLESRCPEDHRHKLALLLEFAPELKVSEVPDPYYGGPQGFEHVLDLIEMASAKLALHVEARVMSGS